MNKVIIGSRQDYRLHSREALSKIGIKIESKDNEVIQKLPISVRLFRVDHPMPKFTCYIRQ